MSTPSLNRLVAEAIVLAGGVHQCVELGHDWRSRGGRACPYSDGMGSPDCSQTVYVCRACGLEDYGDPGGPAHTECIIKGPCSTACEDRRASQTVTPGDKT